MALFEVDRPPLLEFEVSVAAAAETRYPVALASEGLIAVLDAAAFCPLSGVLAILANIAEMESRRAVLSVVGCACPSDRYSDTLLEYEAVAIVAFCCEASEPEGLPVGLADAAE